MLGKCHLCVQLEDDHSLKEIEFCQLCGNWFDDACRKRWWERGLEAVKQLTAGGPLVGCCGPREVA